MRDSWVRCDWCAVLLNGPDGMKWWFQACYDCFEWEMSGGNQVKVAPTQEARET